MLITTQATRKRPERAKKKGVTENGEEPAQGGGTEGARGDEHPVIAGESSEGDRDPREHSEGPEGQVADVPDAAAPGVGGSGAETTASASETTASASDAEDGPSDTADVEEPGLPDPVQTPLFHAQNSDRYARQDLIRRYEEHFDCHLVVMRDVIFPPSVTYLEELIWDADPAQDLHLMLDSPGGDGETAVRLVRACQSRCKELTVIVPNQAKSAGTILLIGAHHVLMGPTSDLGPVDPQFPQPDRPGLYAAKDLIAAVEAAETAIAKNPDTYPLYAALLADVTAVMVQQARSAMERTDDRPQWRAIWRLWTKYFTLDAPVYEGRLASQVIRDGDPFA